MQNNRAVHPPRDLEGVDAGGWLNHARRFLEQAGSQPGAPRERSDLTSGEISLEAQVLLAHVLERPRAWVLAHPEAALTGAQVDRLAGLLERLAGGEPLPYLVGQAHFYGLEFLVSPAVLIPRPETELLVDQALEWLALHNSRRRAADAGAGSGCIAVSLAKHVADLHVLATDLSGEALDVARSNARLHGVTGQITFLRGSLLEAASGPFDLVCANLPYIPGGALAGLAVSRHEPRLALDGGPDGLAAIRALLRDAPRWLARGGLMLLEMQPDQGQAITAMAEKHLPGARVDILEDLAGRPRLVRVERD